MDLKAKRIKQLLVNAKSSAQQKQQKEEEEAEEDDDTPHVLARRHEHALEHAELVLVVPFFRGVCDVV